MRVHVEGGAARRLTVTRSRPASERVHAGAGSVTPSRSRVSDAARVPAPARRRTSTGDGAAADGAARRPRGRGSASARHFAKTSAALPLRETSSSFGSLMPGGYGITRTRSPAAVSFSLSAAVALRPGVVAVEGEDHARDALALHQVEVVGGEAVRAVDRDRRRDAGLVEGERVEHALGEDDLGRAPRGLEVEHAAQRAGRGSSGAACAGLGRRASSTRPSRDPGSGPRRSRRAARGPPA